jgi:endonuclease/exonuclease/phosphatase family metal-dependent hydrolase
VIRQAEPDVVALQEVDKKTKRASGVDQPSELAQLTGMTVIFERNIEYQGGDYGNAVLSRWKVRRHVNHALPSFYVGEQRGVLDLEVEAPGEKVIRFLATHLDYRPADGERLASVEMISKLLASAEARQLPTILAGDLNALPDSAVMQKFREQWTVASGSAATPTYPAPMPTRQLDYVLAYPSTDWKLVEFRVLEERVASDHRPVLAIWEYRK